jgi:hypothetical protein
MRHGDDTDAGVLDPVDHDEGKTARRSSRTKRSAL